MKNTQELQIESTGKKSSETTLSATTISHNKIPTDPEASEESDFTLRASMKAFYIALKR